MCRYRDEVCRLLAAHGCQAPGGELPHSAPRGPGAYLAAMPQVMVDATEVPQSMPIDWAAQRAAWSGKTKDHVVKATVLADPSRRLVRGQSHRGGPHP